MSKNDLEHYGIKGMKWGVRKVFNAPEYSRPYSKREIKKYHGNAVYKQLMRDPAHKFRAKTGIELIHKEPSKKELERIWKNWNLMSKSNKKRSDTVSVKLFGLNNEEHFKYLIRNAYVKDL